MVMKKVYYPRLASTLRQGKSMAKRHAGGISEATTSKACGISIRKLYNV